MNEPNKDTIDRLKAEHDERSLLHVEIDHEEETYHFLMTGPNDVEYKKFMTELLDAKDKSKESEQMDGIRSVVHRAALAQIRWPDRDTVTALFKRFPGMSSRFRDELHKAAGTSAEVRSKKL